MSALNPITFGQSFDLYVDLGYQQQADNPERYKRHVYWLRLLGDVVLWSMFVIFVLLLGGLLVLTATRPDIIVQLMRSTLILLPLSGIYLLGVALFHYVADPEGYPLKPKRFAAINQKITELQGLLGTATIDSLCLSQRMRLNWVSVPRLGILPPYRHILEIGLPVLATTTPEQAETLLAAELAQYSRLQKSYQVKTQCKRKVWIQIYQTIMASERWGIGFFQRFCHYYVPRFAGYSMALAQQGSREADALAKDKTSADMLSSALLKTHVYGEWLERKYWPSVWQQANNDEKVADDVVEGLYVHLTGKHEVSMHDLNVYRRPALYKKVDRYEVTAELAQRLKNIGGRIELSLTEHTASEYWLAPYLPNILAKMGQVWGKQHTEQWQETHRHYQSASQAVRQFMLGRTHDNLDANQWWQLVQLIEQCPVTHETLQHYQQYKQTFPDDARADFMLGKYWAKENDPKAIAYLETAYELPWLADQAAYLISDYYHNNNNRNRALDWQDHYTEAKALKDQAEAELVTLSPEDVLTAPSALSIVEQKLALLGSVHGHPAIKEAWVAQKKINSAADSDVLVMGVITNAGLFQSAQHLETELAEKTHTYRGVHIVTDLSSKKLVGKIKHIGQQIY